MDSTELKIRIAGLPPIENVGHPPYWSYWCNDLRLNIMHNEPHKLFSFPVVYHNFLQNHILNSVWFEYNYMIQDSSDAYINAATMPDFGEPRDYLGDTQYSSNLLHQLYHIKKFTEVSSTDVTQFDTIIEFGAGYGAMSLVLRRLGFKGHYIHYDLPEMLLLQKYYLSNVLPSLKHTSFISSIKTLERHVCKADLLIACGSITEVDYDMRVKFLNSVEFSRFLLMYTNVFENFDNCAWVNSYVSQRHDLNWETLRMVHMPDRAYYTFGF